MINQLEHKDGSIQKTIDKLKNIFGQEAFKVVDHWDADLCAVGIARPGDLQTLVYISTSEQAVDEYFVSLELPSPKPEEIYQSVGDFKKVSFRELIEIVSHHLKIR